MFWLLRGVIALSLVLALFACASLPSLTKVKDTIELAVGMLGAGDWNVSGVLKKNGAAYGTADISWTCRQGADGKLAGCTEPVLILSPTK